MPKMGLTTCQLTTKWWLNIVMGVAQSRQILVRSSLVWRGVEEVFFTFHCIMGYIMFNQEVQPEARQLVLLYLLHGVCVLPSGVYIYNIYIYIYKLFLNIVLKSLLTGKSALEWFVLALWLTATEPLADHQPSLEEHSPTKTIFEQLILGIYHLK